MKTIKNILIVGGGSSGWMTAASLVKNFPEMNITLIESSDIPTIGVGESTIGSINSYLRDLGLKDEDWMSYCNATYKTSIDFENFDGKGTRFRYPFGSSTWSNNVLSDSNPQDWFMKKALIGAEKTEYARFALGSLGMIESNKLTKNEDGQIHGFNFKSDTAYHMDAGLFGEYLKQEFCKPKGVNHIVDDVVKVKQETDGSIKSLVSRNNGELTADLYIDCTGFKSLLLTETLQEPFVSFGHVLQNDKAVAVRMPYVNKDVEMEHQTNATALSSGWVWNIPLWDRIGTGYVYSSKFLTEEEAEAEFRDYLINHRDVKHPKEQIDALEAFHVTIKPGLHERNWVKNVCAIGLSNGFIEPLESTGLMLTHNTIFALVNTLQKRNGKVQGFDISEFNAKVRNGMTKFSGFIAGHFALAERDDTPYWKYVTEEIDYAMDKSLEWSWFNRIIKEIGIDEEWWRVDHLDGSPFIMAGMGYNPISKMRIEQFFTDAELENQYNKAKLLHNTLQDKFRREKEVAETLPTHYEFLKQTIYKEK